MKKYLIITADTNDADYNTEKFLITDTKLEKIKPVIDALSNKKILNKEQHYHNWNRNEYAKNDPRPEEMYPELTSDQIDYFENFLPSTGEEGIHTITDIEVFIVKEEIKLFKNY